jgi:hypothetical protein
MSSALWKSVLINPVILGIALLSATGVIAAPKSNEIDASAPVKGTVIFNKASGVTPVRVAASETTPVEKDSAEVASEIVKPGDWSYTALQSMATKYGCNPNFNNQPVSQIEFARGLNTCLGKVEPMLAQQPSSLTAGDLEVIKKLTQELKFKQLNFRPQRNSKVKPFST